ncbi:MAG TPA: APC family permease [Pyrinomonadaceae bacterium]|nr:APC family permease [Pyrinomonadaceae bacterium]
MSKPAQRGRLLRVLGVGFGLAVIIGNTIGAGIFSTPGGIAQQAPNVWLFLAIWIAGGVYAFLGAIALSELGTMLPESGGQYVFSRYALGEYAGFIVGWSDWISTCGTTAAVSIVIGDFLGVLFPSLAGRSVPIAVAVTVLFAILQWRGIVLGSQVQNVTSLLKALAFLILIVAAFALGAKGAAVATSTSPASLGSVISFVAIMLALQSVIYTYDGWAGVIYFSEEVQDPGRNVPRSLFGGILLIFAIYMLVNLALLYVLGLSGMAGQEFAAGTAARALFGHTGETILIALTIVSMLSGINAYHLMATRVLFAMSRDGLFLRSAARVNPGGTPAVALFFSAAIAVLFIVFGQTFKIVITVLAFFFVANYALSFLSVFVLRRREPNKERPYRAWGYPWTTALALIGSIAFLLGAVASDLSAPAGTTRASIFAVLLLAASYPVFRIVKLFSSSGEAK